MTIKEIAALANVSPGTVSKVLNNKDASISAQTRQKVLQIAKEQHYRPYSDALEASGRRSYLIGALFPRMAAETETLQKALEKRFSDEGYLVIAAFYEDENSMLTCIRGMKQRQTDAVLVYTFSDEADRSMSCDFGIPVFKIGGTYSHQISCAIVDDKVNLTQMAVEYLIEQGHKNIGLLGVHAQNVDCMRDGMARSYFEHGLALDSKAYFCGCNVMATAKHGLHSLLNRGATAIVCENMDIVYGVYKECEHQGFRIPEDVSVLCLQDRPIGALLHPSVTSFDHNIEDCMDNCVATVIKSLEEKSTFESVQGQCVQEMYTLTQRQSVSEPLQAHVAAQAKILVLGSMNMDETIRVKALPGDGETILSDMKIQLPGGKGANQAIGAAKLGGIVYAMGRVGNDADGRKIFAALKQNGVITDGVVFDPVMSTGKAYIHAADNGEGTIVVYPGANQNFSIDQIQSYKYLFERVGYCLLPIEIMAEPMMHALRLCHEYGIITIVKPSLQTELQEEMLQYIDYLVPNEKELNRIVKHGKDLDEKMNWLLSKGVDHVIVTLGNKGCHLKDAVFDVKMNAPDFEPVDVTGAADAFIAALTVYLNKGCDIVAAMCYASYAAGISITRMGVQPAMADKMMMDVYQDEIQKNIFQMKSKISNGKYKKYPVINKQ